MGQKYTPPVSYSKAKKTVKDAVADAITGMFGADASDDNGRWVALLDDFSGELQGLIDDGESAAKAKKSLHDRFKSDLIEMVQEELTSAIESIDFES